MGASVPESNTPIALSTIGHEKRLTGRRHLIAKLFFAAWDKTENLFPHLFGFHAEIDFDGRGGSANPAEHLTVDVDAHGLKITQLPVRAEHLLAGKKPCLWKAPPDNSFQARCIAQDSHTQPCDSAPIDATESLVEHIFVITFPIWVLDYRVKVETQPIPEFWQRRAASRRSLREAVPCSSRSMTSCGFIDHYTTMRSLGSRTSSPSTQSLLVFNSRSALDCSAKKGTTSRAKPI